MEAADQSVREKKGYGDGLTQALTLVVAPVLFGLLGAFIDSLLGTSPLFLLVLGFVGILATSRDRLLRVRGADRAPRRGEAVGTAQSVDVTAYEGEVARDLARRALIVAPVPIVLGAIFAGVDGAVSAVIGLVLVAANFLVAARIITWTAQRSPGAVMGVVLGGYLVRMAVLFGIALALGERLLHRPARALAHDRGGPSGVARVGDPPREPLLGRTRAQARSCGQARLSGQVGEVAGVCTRGFCFPADRRALPLEGRRVQRHARSRSTRPRSSCSPRRS